jgi:hypothetical protein
MQGILPMQITLPLRNAGVMGHSVDLDNDPAFRPDGIDNVRPTTGHHFRIEPRLGKSGISYEP